MRRLRFEGAFCQRASGSAAELIAGSDTMPSKEFGGGEWLLARELDNQEPDGAFARRDDQAISDRLDDFTGVSLAVDDPSFVDNQPAWLLRCRRYCLPGRLRHGPGLHRAHEVMNGLRWLVPVNQAVFLA